ncbi:MAG: ATP-binding protein, partial [Thermoflexales bacterium]|nr:ATP-binding protein [Thermoflexales bacterium]
MGDVTELKTISLTLPNLPVSNIARPNLVSWLHDRFTRERRVIVVKGPDGSGKTSLLAQFAHAYPDQCFSYFVGSDSWGASTRHFLLEMCTQMQFIVGAQQQDIDDLGDSELRQLFMTFYRRVARQARSQRSQFYFVVDGLDWISTESAPSSILSLLPHDPPEGLYLLASTNPEQVLPFQHDSWPIQFFSPSESEVYFSDIGFSRDNLNLIYQACQGLPGYQAEIRREVQSGKALADILSNLPMGFRSLLDRRWKQAQVGDETTQDALAVLAHTEPKFLIADLANIVRVEANVLEDT